MLIEPNNYLWSRVPIITVDIAPGEQLIDVGSPIRIYRIEGEATISLYEDAEKTNLIFEGALPTEFNTPFSCDTVYVISNDDSTYFISNTMNFVFNGATVSTVYVNSNSWYGFGNNTAHLQIMNRDGYAQYIYYQKGSLREDLDFLKIRFDGYTVYNKKNTSNRLIYELFLL